MEIIEENSDIDVENSCRTCLISFRDNPDRSYESIFTAIVENTMFREILNQVTPQIQIDNEKLSQYICNTCFDSVISSYNFQKMVYENERNVLMFLDLRNDLDEKGTDGLEQINALEASDDENSHEEQDESNNVLLPEITEVLMEDIDGNIQEEVEIGSEMEEESIETSDKLIVKDEPSVFLKGEVIHEVVVEKTYKCEVCSKEFKKLSLLSRHRKTHENTKKPHECSKCQKRFPSEVALFRHDIIHSDLVERSKIERIEEHNFVCVICNNFFKTHDLLTIHHKTHKATLGESQDIMCKLCMSPFGTFTDIIRHSRNHIENATHQCIICNKLFVLNDEAIDHFLRHKGQKPHKCPICDISFLKLHRLNNHMKTHNDDKSNSYLCPECGKSLSTNENLKRHLIRHTGIKPFSCSLCPSRFVFKSGLTSHMSTHLGLKPFQCDICGSAFTKSSSLTKHHRIHTGERPYVCEVCGMRFNSPDHVKRHIRIHTGERPYKCQYCEKSYTQSNDLLKHTRIHVGENTYQCSYCSEAFRLQTQLRDHYRIHYESKTDIKHLVDSDQKPLLAEIFVDEQQRRDQLEFVQNYDIIRKEKKEDTSKF